MTTLFISKFCIDNFCVIATIFSYITTGRFCISKYNRVFQESKVVLLLTLPRPTAEENLKVRGSTHTNFKRYKAHLGSKSGIPSVEIFLKNASVANKRISSDACLSEMFFVLETQDIKEDKNDVNLVSSS